MGRKKAGGGTPADLGQLKLEVVLNATQAEQFKNLCTILMQSPGQLAKEMVLDAMWKETLQILKSVALSYSADLPDLQGDACGPICRPSGPSGPGEVRRDLLRQVHFGPRHNDYGLCDLAGKGTPRRRS